VGSQDSLRELKLFVGKFSFPRKSSLATAPFPFSLDFANISWYTIKVKIYLQEFEPI